VVEDLHCTAPHCTLEKDALHGAALHPGGEPAKLFFTRERMAAVVFN
jgi:hypothetical protein